ncbi:hypothetical protein M3558_22980 [Brevibacillus invocatus]|nr:hypothetical protein [Brevibacillus invocatus]MCM3081859.1 hypothetical protein [Brevibacillus invocatus]MCM3432266.1 hypothetical protein [Brevibacillus invocatus]
MYKELSPSLRTIMTPGPVEAEPRVLRAMSIRRAAAKTKTALIGTV